MWYIKEDFIINVARVFQSLVLTSYIGPLHVDHFRPKDISNWYAPMKTGLHGCSPPCCIASDVQIIQSVRKNNHLALFCVLMERLETSSGGAERKTCEEKRKMFTEIIYLAFISFLPIGHALSSKRELTINALSLSFCLHWHSTIPTLPSKCLSAALLPRGRNIMSPSEKTGVLTIVEKHVL